MSPSFQRCHSLTLPEGTEVYKGLLGDRLNFFGGCFFGGYKHFFVKEKMDFLGVIL